jgi:predicted SAM-dependent methyltransferase
MAQRHTQTRTTHQLQPRLVGLGITQAASNTRTYHNEFWAPYLIASRAMSGNATPRAAQTQLKRTATLCRLSGTVWDCRGGRATLGTAGSLLSKTNPPRPDDVRAILRRSPCRCDVVRTHVGTPHLEEAAVAARVCWSYLKVGGRLRVAVPDGRFPDPEYQRTVRVVGPGPADHPAAGHRVLYVAETFAAVFLEAGFSVQLLEWWDSGGVFNVAHGTLTTDPSIVRRCSTTATLRIVRVPGRRGTPASFSTPCTRE